MEALPEADPDVTLALWTVTETFDFDGLKQNLRDDPVGRELAAARNNRVYPQGTRWQGPLMNLLQTEMTAEQLYPERFGAQPTYEDGDGYPDFGVDKQLFDHVRVEEFATGGSLQMRILISRRSTRTSHDGRRRPRGLRPAGR